MVNITASRLQNQNILLLLESNLYEVQHARPLTEDDNLLLGG